MWYWRNGYTEGITKQLSHHSVISKKKMVLLLTDKALFYCLINRELDHKWRKRMCDMEQASEGGETWSSQTRPDVLLKNIIIIIIIRWHSFGGICEQVQCYAYKLLVIERWDEPLVQSRLTVATHKLIRSALGSWKTSKFKLIRYVW